jgi:cytochrome c oxidase cbb3-type subunit 2/cytochrome c oxidase cbb3-type subunit I/II
LRLRDWLGITGVILYYQIMNGIPGTAILYFKSDLESQKICEGETTC